MTKTHKLNELGNGCTCETYGCKKWRDSISTPGKEKRCPRCWTLASILDVDEGKYIDWCHNCRLPI